ncbi:MAG: DUF58 domain-containing protein [Chloroflexota bacterium]
MNPAATIRLRRPLPAVWLLLLLVAAVLLPDRIWNTLLIGLGGLFLVAYLWARQMARGLSATRRLRFGWVSVGDRLEEEFELRNRSWLPALWVEIVDGSNVPGYQAAVVRGVGATSADHWRQAAVCQQRGHYHLGPWAIRTADPFSLFTVTYRYPISDEVIIYPPIHTRLPIRLPAGQSGGRAQVRQRAWQATVNAATVRDYHPHDPMNWIHWPTSVRRATADLTQLYVRQFDLDVGGDLWLVLDMNEAEQVGEGPAGTEEQSVLLAAALAAEALRQNRAVGLAAYGEAPQLVAPATGQGQQWKLLRALALVQANGEMDLAVALRDLNQVARRGVSAVIVTPSGRADWLPALLPLAQRGIQGHVILLDRRSFGGQGNSQGLAEAIRELGFPCQVIRQGEMGRPAAEMERRGYWEFRVLATGKVVTMKSPTSA